MFNWSDLTADFIQKSIAEVNEAVGGGLIDFTKDGEYHVHVKRVDAEPRNGKSKLSLLLQADTGESGWFNLNIYHDNPVAAKIAAQHLAIIAANAGRPVKGPNDLKDVKFVVGVKMKEWGDRLMPNFTPRPPKATKATPAAQTAPTAPAKPAAKAAVDVDDDIPF